MTAGNYSSGANPILISLEVLRPGRGMGKKRGKDKNFVAILFYRCLRYVRLIS
jgi:hypothetical protein